VTDDKKSILFTQCLSLAGPLSSNSQLLKGVQHIESDLYPETGCKNNLKPH